MKQYYTNNWNVMWLQLRASCCLNVVILEPTCNTLQLCNTMSSTIGTYKMQHPQKKGKGGWGGFSLHGWRVLQCMPLEMAATTVVWSTQRRSAISAVSLLSALVPALAMQPIMSSQVPPQPAATNMKSSLKRICKQCQLAYMQISWGAMTADS